MSTTQTATSQVEGITKMAEIKKEEKKMVIQETQTKLAEKEKIEILKAQAVKPKQKVIDLDNPDKDDVTVQLEYDILSINEKAPVESVTAELNKLVSPQSERNKALLNFANSQAYQKAKEKAFAAGNYLTPELKGAIVDALRMSGRFNDNTAKEIFTRWLDAYRGTDPVKKTSAKKVLDRVSEWTEMADAL